MAAVSCTILHLPVGCSNKTNKTHGPKMTQGPGALQDPWSAASGDSIWPHHPLQRTCWAHQCSWQPDCWKGWGCLGRKIRTIGPTGKAFDEIFDLGWKSADPDRSNPDSDSIRFLSTSSLPSLRLRSSKLQVFRSWAWRSQAVPCRGVFPWPPASTSISCPRVRVLRPKPRQEIMERWWKDYGILWNSLVKPKILWLSFKQKPHVPQIDILIHRGAQENSQAYPLSLHHPPWYDEICSGKIYKWWKATVDVCKALWFWLCHCCVRRIPRASSLRSSLFSKIGQYEAFVAFPANCPEVLDRCWLHCESLPHCGLNFGLNSDHVDMNHMFLISALHCILVFSWFGQYFPRSTNIIKEIGCGKDRDTGQGHRSDSCPNPVHLNSHKMMFRSLQPTKIVKGVVNLQFLAFSTVTPFPPLYLGRWEQPWFSFSANGLLFISTFSCSNCWHVYVEVESNRLATC